MVSTVTDADLLGEKKNVLGLKSSNSDGNWNMQLMSKGLMANTSTVLEDWRYSQE